MNIQNSTHSEPQQTMCKGCKSFYGSESFDWHCSACFKKLKLEKKQVTVKKEEKVEIQPISQIQEIKVEEPKEEEEPKPEVKKQEDRKRCFNCRKKVGLLGTQCKCGFVYCNSHRLPQSHQCDFNFKKEGTVKLGKELEKVSKNKIAEI